MTQRDDSHDLRDSINRDRIYQQKKLEGLDNAINSLNKWKKIVDLIKKHAELETELSSGKVDKKLFADKSKEYSDLNDIINDLTDRFIDLKDNNKQ